jgi:anti-anti-sigma regulatory factor
VPRAACSDLPRRERAAGDTTTTAVLTEAAAPRSVVLDVTGVGFLSSAGLAELVSAHQRPTVQEFRCGLVDQL